MKLTEFFFVQKEAWQESCWHIISAYFDEKGLVRQQLESFDEFITMSVQRIVEETPLIELQSENQYTSTANDEPSKFNIRFEQIYLSKESFNPYLTTGMPFSWNTWSFVNKL